MNQYPGVLGRKLGMTQVFREDGSVVACTVIQARPVVVGKRTQAKDGYDALILGADARDERHTSKPLAGQFKKANVSPRRALREFRCPADFAAKFEVGQEITVADVFEEGQFVDVQGTSRGKGFAGVMKRHHFKGAVRSHGAHEYKRHGGSIGTNMTPGRTLPGKRMPGQLGAATSTVPNQRIVKVIPEQNLILVAGGIPGAPQTLVAVRGAVRKAGGRPKS